MNTEEVLFELGGYKPALILRDGKYVYVVPVDFGHYANIRDIPITKREADILLADLERFVFLWAAVHPYYQSGLKLGPRIRKIVETVVLGSDAEVETFLTREDRMSRGGVRNLASKQLGYDVGDGQWFGLGHGD